MDKTIKTEENFFVPNFQKSLLFLVLIIFAPIPYYLFLLAGTAPALKMIYLILEIMQEGSIMGVMVFGGAIFMYLAIFFFLFYLISCFIHRLIQKTTENTGIQWALILSWVVFWVILSFFKIYLTLDAGGGKEEYNILEVINRFIRLF